MYERRNNENQTSEHCSTAYVARTRHTLPVLNRLVGRGEDITRGANCREREAPCKGIGKRLYRVCWCFVFHSWFRRLPRPRTGPRTSSPTELLIPKPEKHWS